MKLSLVLLMASLSFMFSPALHAAEDARNFDLVLNNMIAKGDLLLSEYDPESSLISSDQFSRLYFDQFESSGLEFRLAATLPKLAARIELGFSEVINTAVRGSDTEILLTQWQNLKQDLLSIPVSDLNLESWGSSFSQSLIILLREGIEAILLISLLVTLLSRAGHGDKIWLIWAGSGSALIASVIAAYFLNTVLANSGQAREMMEGVILMFAALLLCYVSLWLLSQQEAKKWQQFLHERIEHGLQQSNQITVFFMAFIAVFREGAETILFYQALLIETQSFTNALLFGVLAASGLLLVFYFFLNRIVRWLRLDYFFKGSAILLFMMAVIFTGKGIMELQTSGYISVTRIEGVGFYPALGIFPTAQSLCAQLFLVLICLAIILTSLYKKRQVRNV